jgi:hypothetical protein
MQTFESSLAQLQKACAFIKPYCLTLDTHLQTIQSRCLVVALTDQVRVAECFSSTAQATRVQLLRAAAAEAIVAYHVKEKLVRTSTTLQSSPLLQCEAHLQAVSFWLLAEYALNAAESTSEAHEPSSSALSSLESSLDMVVSLAGCFSSTKPFMETASRLRQAFDDISLGLLSFALPRIDCSSVRAVEKGFRGVAAGSLVLCPVGHPFPEKVFGDGCPVCGKVVRSREDEFRLAGKKLFEEQFLMVLRRA